LSKYQQQAAAAAASNSNSRQQKQQQQATETATAGSSISSRYEQLRLHHTCTWCPLSSGAGSMAPGTST